MEQLSLGNFHGGNDLDTAIIVQIKNNYFVIPKRCSFYNYDIKSIHEFNLHQFDLILLDPPWWNKSIRRKKAKFQKNG